MSARPAPLPAPIKRLLRRFRARRPLRAGSLLVTIFGDALAPRGGAVTLGSLIRLAAPFGVTERLVRTSVARLAHDGWLLARRAGRQSEYRLTTQGAERFAAATRRIYSPAPEHWEGTWTLLLLVAPLARRAALREELRWRGFGQLSAALYAHPSLPGEEVRGWLATLEDAPEALLFSSRGEARASDRRLAAQGWDLKELTRRYRRFLDEFAPLAPVVRAGLSAETAFLVRTLLIHEYRRIHLKDPLLPPALLPEDWVGTAAYELCRALYAGVYARAEGYLAGTAHPLCGPLPAAEASAGARFGGLAGR
ncbi:MAG TPA: phenylacetic acid degradation operon negative regulatory protein PaaX [Steroidobacteraceae bacterium]|nr:phenylacetic acid degradation operon negative regulatory protein PaaX [Steroidobacteraceae bacterium]